MVSFHGVTYSQGQFAVAVSLHVGLGVLCIFACQHLDKSMALIFVDDACLDCSKASENSTKFGFWYTIVHVSSSLEQLDRSLHHLRYSSNEQSSAKHANGARWESTIELDPSINMGKLVAISMAWAW